MQPCSTSVFSGVSYVVQQIRNVSRRNLPESFHNTGLCPSVPCCAGCDRCISTTISDCSIPPNLPLQRYRPNHHPSKRFTPALEYPEGRYSAPPKIDSHVISSSDISIIAGVFKMDKFNSRVISDLMKNDIFSFAKNVEGTSICSIEDGFLYNSLFYKTLPQQIFTSDGIVLKSRGRTR